jgi:hypothetical protein
MAAKKEMVLRFNNEIFKLNKDLLGVSNEKPAKTVILKD